MPTSSKYIIWLLLSLTVICIITLVLAKQKTSSQSHSGAQQQAASCTKNCSANKQLDPLMEPAYNMQRVIENALLLEDHLADDKRYCIECSAKHFLLIIGFLNEAEWMAGADVGKYPLLKESIKFYNETYKYWLKNKNDKTVRLVILEKLRAHRKNLMAVYVLSG